MLKLSNKKKLKIFLKRINTTLEKPRFHLKMNKVKKKRRKEIKKRQT